MLKLKKPGISFIFIVLALILTVAAFILFISTYNVFSYEINRWAVTCSILSIWGLVFLSINTLIKGEKQFWTMCIYPIIVFLLTYAVLQFIKPCLSPIGIYFTVKNMGDTATSEIGVPRAIITTVLFLLAIISSIVAALLSKKDKEVSNNGN